MRLGTYIISGLIFLFAITGAIYIIEPSDYNLELLGYSLDLPIALWAVIPALLLFIVSILHIAFYGTRTFMKNRKWLKDFKELKDALYWGVLKEPKKHTFHTEQMKSIGNLLNVSKIEIKESVELENEKLNSIVKMVNRVKGGEYVDLRDLGLDVYLSKDNEISIKNGINRLKKEPEFAKTVLAKKEAYGADVVKEALKIAIESLDFNELVEYNDLIDRDSFYRILELVDSGKKGGFSIESLKKFIDYEEFECRDFIRVAETTIKKFTPDANLALAKEMVKKSPKADSSYLFMLFEYEMRDSIKRFFEEHDESEFKIFRIFEEIKNSGHSVKIEDLINYESACR